MTAHVLRFGRPTGINPERFHLIAPYDNDPRRWLSMEWIDQYSGKHYRITTTGHHGARDTARVKTHNDVRLEYEFHAESKCADASGQPCGKQTAGPLQRRHVRVNQIKYIGKESNNLEGVEAGVVHSEQEVYTEYPDARRDVWEMKIRPALSKLSLAVLEKETGLSRRMLIDARTGRRRPHLVNQKKILAVLQRYGVIKSELCGATSA